MDIGKDIQLPFIPEENAGEEANKRWRDEISEAIKELHTGLIKSPDVTPPIGAIIAWHEDFTNTPALPDGWVECNGLPLDDPDSVYDGQTIPDLNGDERFLRGSSTSGTEQPDAFQGHFHDVVPELLLNTGSAFSTGSNDTGTGGFIDTGAAITDGANGAPRTADETRPVNMSVIWIMRIK